LLCWGWGALTDFGVAGDLGDVFERALVGNPAADDAGAVVIEDGVGAVSAPTVVRLGQVLEDGDELHAVAGAGGRDDIEVRKGCDVGRLVETTSSGGSSGRPVAADRA
jgi:hypothetical protein